MSTRQRSYEEANGALVHGRVRLVRLAIVKRCQLALLDELAGDAKVAVSLLVHLSYNMQ